MAIDTIGTKSGAAATGRGLSEAIEKIDFGAWTVTESGGNINFAYNGSTKVTLTSTGNIDLTGNVNVSGLLDLGNWTINENGSGLFFAHGGTDRIKMNSNGNIDMSGDVNSNDSSIT